MGARHAGGSVTRFAATSPCGWPPFSHRSEFLPRRPLHGYAIAQLIQQLYDDLLRVEEGSLYPALQRLELNGWIEGEWGVSANNRRARFYKLTADGRKHLAAESARYLKVTGAVARIMGFA